MLAEDPGITIDASPQMFLAPPDPNRTARMRITLTSTADTRPVVPRQMAAGRRALPLVVHVPELALHLATARGAPGTTR
jgi:hypothetical protein